jgi:hypothetical protein
MFKLDMQAIRENAKDLLTTANTANSANESVSVFKLAALATLAVSKCESHLNPPADPSQWRELDRAYFEHHFTCETCIAAGQGYGWRCGVGASLWNPNSSSKFST